MTQREAVQLVVLSPHLDDAVFAVGGLLARATATGRRALVATVNTQGPDAETPLSRWLVPFADLATRREEDRRALALLGVEHLWLGYRERSFRRPPLRRPLATFTTPPDVDGFANLSAVQCDVARLLQLHPGAQLLAPLGAGNHVDHVEVFLAVTGLVLRDPSLAGRVRYYEDTYAVGALVRRSHPVTRTVTWSPWRSPEGASPTLRVLGALIAAARRGPPVATYLGADWERLTWSLERSPLDGCETRKLAAVRRYESQLDAMGGADAFCAALRAYHRRFGGAEPVWRVAVRE